MREADVTFTVEGVFHLMYFSEWKINDIYFLTVNQQPLDTPISFARDYRLMLGGPNMASNQFVGTNTTAAVHSTFARQTSTAQTKLSPGWWRMAPFVVRGVIVAAISGLVARKASRRPGPRPKAGTNT